MPFLLESGHGWSRDCAQRRPGAAPREGSSGRGLCRRGLRQPSVHGCMDAGSGREMLLVTVPPEQAPPSFALRVLSGAPPSPLTFGQWNPDSGLQSPLPVCAWTHTGVSGEPRTRNQLSSVTGLHPGPERHCTIRICPPPLCARPYVGACLPTEAEPSPPRALSRSSLTLLHVRGSGRSWRP